MLAKSIPDTDHSHLQKLGWSVSGHSVDGNVDFAGKKAIAMACDKGATLPSPALEGFFRHTPIGRDILMFYNGSSWIPIISLGAMTIYVDGTNGTDSQNKGFGTG